MTPRDIMAGLAEAFEDMTRERYLAEAAAPTVFDWRRVFAIMDSWPKDYTPSKAPPPADTVAVPAHRLASLKKAVEFYDRVRSGATPDERIAVGQDHLDWLISAAKELVAETAP